MLCRSSGEQRELACNHRHTCFYQRHLLLLSAEKRICPAGSTLSSGKNSCSWKWQRQLVIRLVGISLLGHRSQWSSDRKSTRLNSSHVRISYAVFCLKKKKKKKN